MVNRKLKKKSQKKMKKTRFFNNYKIFFTFMSFVV